MITRASFVRCHRHPFLVLELIGSGRLCPCNRCCAFRTAETHARMHSGCGVLVKDDAGAGMVIRPFACPGNGS